MDPQFPQPPVPPQEPQQPPVPPQPQFPQQVPLPPPQDQMQQPFQNPYANPQYAPAPMPGPKKSKTGLIIGIVVVVVLLLGGGAAALILLGSKKSNTSTNSGNSPKKESKLNPLYDSTPTTDDTYKTPCYRYEIPKPHGAIYKPLDNCSGENLFDGPGPGGEGLEQYEIQVSAYHDTKGATEEGCHDYTRFIINDLNGVAGFKETEVKVGGQKALLFTPNPRTDGGTQIGQRFYSIYLDRELTDPWVLKAGDEPQPDNVRCFDISIQIPWADALPVFDSIIDSWIWR